MLKTEKQQIIKDVKFYIESGQFTHMSKKEFRLWLMRNRWSFHESWKRREITQVIDEALNGYNTNYCSIDCFP